VDDDAAAAGCGEFDEEPVAAGADEPDPFDEPEPFEDESFEGPDPFEDEPFDEEDTVDEEDDPFEPLRESVR
jgi:hypothetical protein